MEGSKINSILTLEYIRNEKENQFFDRKSAKKSVKEMSNHISGFANSSGGTLVIGISDDGIIEGFENYKDKIITLVMEDIELQKSIKYKYFCDIGEL